MTDKLKAKLLKRLEEALAEELCFSPFTAKVVQADEDGFTVEAGLWEDLPEEGGSPPTRRFRLTLT